MKPNSSRPSSSSSRRKLLPPAAADKLLACIVRFKVKSGKSWSAVSADLGLTARTLLRWRTYRVVDYFVGTAIAKKLACVITAPVETHAEGDYRVFAETSGMPATWACQAGAWLLTNATAPGLKMELQNGVCLVGVWEGQELVRSVRLGSSPNGLAYKLEAYNFEDTYCGAGVATTKGLSFCVEFLNKPFPRREACAGRRCKVGRTLVGG